MLLDDGSSVLIREMTGHDVTPLAEALEYPVQWIARRWSERLVGHREALVGEVDGRPVGTVSVNTQDAIPGFAVLSALEVAPALRNRGIGAALIARVEAAARALGRRGVSLDVGIENDNARRLYERVGYVPEGEPFVSSWTRYDENGEPVEVTETFQRMLKRF